MEHKADSRDPRRNWVRRLGIGCAATVACFVILAGLVAASGMLRGTRINNAYAPAWSPDGSRIAFVSEREGTPDIYIMNADGSHVVQLTDDPFAIVYFLRSSTDDWPAWSPDGKLIAFDSGRDNQDMSYTKLNVYLMDTSGLHIRNLTGSVVDTGNHDFAFGVRVRPAWSPDGKRIAFLSGAGLSNSPRNIYVMSADGSKLTQLTHDSADKNRVSWSPDGQHIVFDETDGTNGNIFIINSDGLNRVRLIGDMPGVGDPVWSPDGSRIAFESNLHGSFQIYVMNADGSNVVQLTEDHGQDGNPVWSPDGSTIAFQSYRDGNAQIYAVNADGSNLVQITGR